MTCTRSEARHTPPSDAVPHPEWWHAQDADSAEDEVAELVAAIVRAIQPEVAVETGTAHGRTAAAIGSALAANEHGHLWTFETDQQRAAAAAESLVALPVTVVHASSLDPYALPGPIGFAWIDSDPALRVEEIMHYQRKLAHGAIVAMHDTAAHHPWGEVMAQDLRVLERGGWRRIDLATPRGVAILQRA